MPNKTNREELMSNQSQPQNEQSATNNHDVSEINQGHLSNRDILEKFLSPSYRERIMLMIEDRMKAETKAINRRSLSELIVPIIGQVLTFLLGAGGIFTCIYLTKAGYTGPAIATIVSSFAPIIINASRNLRRKT